MAILKDILSKGNYYNSNLVWTTRKGAPHLTTIKSQVMASNAEVSLMTPMSVVTHRNFTSSGATSKEPCIYSIEQLFTSAQAYYQVLRSRNSGRVNYRYTDVAKYLLDIRNYHAVLIDAIKYYLSVNNIDYINYSTPREATFAAGMVTNDDSLANSIIDNKATIIDKLNYEITMFNQIVRTLPLNLLDYDRYLFGNLFLDSSKSKAVIKGFSVKQYCTLDPNVNSDEFGLIISTLPTLTSWDGMLNRVSQFRKAYNSGLTTEFITIQGDIEKVTGAINPYSIPLINSIARVSCVHDSELNSALVNAVFYTIPAGVAPFNTSLESNNIELNPNIGVAMLSAADPGVVFDRDQLVTVDSDAPDVLETSIALSFTTSSHFDGKFFVPDVINSICLRSASYLVYRFTETGFSEVIVPAWSYVGSLTLPPEVYACVTQDDAATMIQRFIYIDQYQENSSTYMIPEVFGNLKQFTTVSRQQMTGFNDVRGFAFSFTHVKPKDKDNNQKKPGNKANKKKHDKEDSNKDQIIDETKK